MAGATQGEKLAALERGLSDHESRCEERLIDIKGVVAETNTKVDKLQGFVVSLIVAVCGGSVIILVAIVLRALDLGS